MKKFTPDDLKKQWPGKYDNWKFAVNGKGEWIGVQGSTEGKIVSVKDKNGVEIPDLKSHKTVSTAGLGGNIIKQGLDALFHGNQDGLGESEK